MLCTVEEIRKREAATSRYKPPRRQKLGPTARVILSKLKPSVMKVTDGNDEALAAGIALAATMESFVCIHETSHVGTNMAHRVQNSSSKKNGRLLPNKSAPGHEERLNE